MSVPKNDLSAAIAIHECTAAPASMRSAKGKPTELEKFAESFRNKAQQSREEHPEDPFAGHDYDDCANEIEMYLNIHPCPRPVYDALLATTEAAALDAAQGERGLSSWIINNLLNESQLDVVPPGCDRALRYLDQPQAPPAAVPAGYALVPAESNRSSLSSIDSACSETPFEKPLHPSSSLPSGTGRGEGRRKL